MLAAVVLGFLTLALAAGTAVWAVSQNQRYARQVNHTYEAAKAISELRTLTENAETARRSILLTGQQRFIDVYAEVSGQIPAQLAKIARTTADNPRQAEAVERLGRLNRLQVSLFEDALALVRAGRRETAAKEFGFNSSPEVMTAHRRVTGAMMAEEGRRLALRGHERDRTGRLVYQAFAAAGLVLLLVGSGSIWVIRRHTQDLATSRDRLAALNEGLEGAVRDRTADLTRANDEIQRFAYIVSHDLRSPLVNVMGFTSELETAAGALKTLVDRAEVNAPHILTAEAREAVDSDLPEAIGFIRTSTQKMDRLINAILRLSREGRRVLAPEPLDMAAVMESVAASLKHRSDHAGVEIVIERPMPSLNNDRVAIEQVFSNLVENAVKYAKPGKSGRVVVRGREDFGRVIFEVQDDGRGIDSKDHERIFELFRRSGAQDQPGEGIGLAHVRALVYRLGGVITCESALDRGALFRVSLPPYVIADPGGSP